ncbi:hypothetical protein D8N35_06380 [Enterococcus casseliflavus]|nr:hypothetical protein D8N35_06380 [Enterococcus casseliflavus]
MEKSHIENKKNTANVFETLHFSKNVHRNQALFLAPFIDEVVHFNIAKKLTYCYRTFFSLTFRTKKGVQMNDKDSR